MLKPKPADGSPAPGHTESFTAASPLEAATNIRAGAGDE
jgi:hypothetical protein